MKQGNADKNCPYCQLANGTWSPPPPPPHRLTDWANVNWLQDSTKSCAVSRWSHHFPTLSIISNFAYHILDHYTLIKLVKAQGIMTSYEVLKITTVNMCHIIENVIIICIVPHKGVARLFKRGGRKGAQGGGAWGLKMAALHRPLYKVPFHQGGLGFRLRRLKPLPSGYAPAKPPENFHSFCELHKWDQNFLWNMCARSTHDSASRHFLKEGYLIKSSCEAPCQKAHYTFSTIPNKLMWGPPRGLLGPCA